METQEMQRIDPRQAYVSPAVGSDRIGDLLFHWETRHSSPLRRRASAWWLRSRRLASMMVLGAALFLVGAAVALEPQLDTEVQRLEQQLREARGELQARQGELQLARLELARLQDIMVQAQAHRIDPELATAIYDIARAEGISPALAYSLVRVESDFTPRAVSSAGAVGLTQVMPSTAFWMQPSLTYGELFERDTNLRLGFRYLRMMLSQYKGDLRLALLAYNRGPGRVDEILSAGGNPSNGYAGAVRAGVRGTRGE